MKIGKIFKLLGATFLLTTVMAVGVSAATTTYVKATEYKGNAVLVYGIGSDTATGFDGSDDSDVQGYAGGSKGATIQFKNSDGTDAAAAEIPKYYSTDGKTWIPLNADSIPVSELTAATKFYFSNDPSANLASTFKEGHIFVPAKPTAPKGKDIFGTPEVDVDNNITTLHAVTASVKTTVAAADVVNNKGTVIATSTQNYKYSNIQVRVGYGQWYDLEGYVSTFNPVKGLVVQIQLKPTATNPSSKIATYTIPGLTKAPAATYDAKSASLVKMAMPAKGATGNLEKEYALVYRSTTDKAATALTANELQLLKPYWTKVTAASVTITTAAYVNISTGSAGSIVTGGSVGITSADMSKALKSSDQLILVVRLSQTVVDSTTKPASLVKLFTGVAASEQKQLARDVDFKIDVQKGILYGLNDKGIDYSFDNKTWKTLAKYDATKKATTADLVAQAKKTLIESKNFELFVRSSAVMNASNQKLVDTPSSANLGPVGYLVPFKDYTKAPNKGTADLVVLSGITETIKLGALKDLDVEVTSSAATETNPVWVKVGNDESKKYAISDAAVWAVLPSDTATVTYRVRVAGSLSNAAVSASTTTYEAITLASNVKTIAIAKRPALASFPSATTAKVDYINEKLVGFTGFEVTTKASNQVKSDFVAFDSFSVTNALSETSLTLKLRKAGTDGAKPTIASVVKDLVITDRPAAPTGITINTTGGATTVTLSSAPTAELKLQVTKDNWVTITELTFAKDVKTAIWSSGPAATEVAKVRLKATDKAFYSKDAPVTATGI